MIIHPQPLGGMLLYLGNAFEDILRQPWEDQSVVGYMAANQQVAPSERGWEQLATSCILNGLG